MTAFRPIQFGKYLLMDRIATGGMAELYRAKMTGIQGFEKLIAIKRILPHLTADESLVNAFIDEAKLAALLHHQNIVQIYNFGVMEDSYFIAMEFLFGKDLRFIMQKSMSKKRPLGLDHALYIASRICAGLDYAHNLKDFQGSSLNIIHRDIGPHNIFITYDGQVKIIDFGIAKAANQNSTTQMGSIKGKVAYMSPEQALGKGIDHRSDLFSIGIVLYEMVTNRQMFSGDTFEAYAKVREAAYEPPEKVKKDLPPSVCRILHKALAKEPSRRYQSGDAMLSDIERCMSECAFQPNDRTLAQYMKKLFGRDAGAEERAMRDAVLLDPEESPKTVEQGDTSKITLNQGTIPVRRRSRRHVITTLVTLLIILTLLAAMTIMQNPVSPSSRIKAVLTGRGHGSGPAGSGTAQGNGTGGVPDAGLASAPQLSGGILSRQEARLLEEANALVSSGRFKEAISLCEGILAKAPAMTEKIVGPYARALQGYATLMMDTNQAEAKALLVKSIMLYPESAQGHYYLGRMYDKEKNTPGAIASYQKAIELDPNLSRAFFNLGYLYAMSKDYAGAERMYERVVALAPPFVDEAYFNLALVYIKRGQVQKGIQSLDAAHRTNPGNEQAKKLLQQMKRQSGRKK
ncbi:MAG: protein kinase domain-containing protein [bacterium]